MSPLARSPHDAIVAAPESQRHAPGPYFAGRVEPRASTIVCATDFSAHAAGAADVAAKLARARGVELLLIHVIGEVSNAGIAAATQDLETEASRLRTLGLEVRTLTLDGGNRVKSLVTHLEAEPAALVVVSSDVIGPVDRWALGSFAEQLAESSPVPTLVVRDPAAFESWDWINRRLKVLLALDLYSTSNAVLRWAREFRVTGPCDFVACYFNPCRPPADAETAGNPLLLQLELNRELQKKVRDQIGDDCCDVVVRPCLGEPARCVAGAAADVKADLVVVGAHQRHGLARLGHMSVSRKLLRDPDLNVVCVPVSVKFNPADAHIPEFRRVLVSTDLSDLGDAAIPLACAACAPGGTVRIIHVVKPRTPALREAGTGWAADLRETLRSLVPAEAGGRCRTVEVDVLESRDPAAAICNDAEHFGADLVCLASHGLGLSRAIHGSTTKGVLRKIRRPILILRRPDE